MVSASSSLLAVSRLPSIFLPDQFLFNQDLVDIGHIIIVAVEHATRVCPLSAMRLQTRLNAPRSGPLSKTMSPYSLLPLVIGRSFLPGQPSRDISQVMRRCCRVAKMRTPKPLREGGSAATDTLGAGGSRTATQSPVPRLEFTLLG